VKESHTQQIKRIYKKYRGNWKEHVERMSADRIPRKILKYEPKGKRSLGRPLIQWKDSLSCNVLTGLEV
jgi:hypothetical protein